MVEYGYQQVIAHLSGSLVIQADTSQQRLTREWSQMSLCRLLAMWMRLDAHETLAYEDKVAAQVHILCVGELETRLDKQEFPTAAVLPGREVQLLALMRRDR